MIKEYLERKKEERKLRRAFRQGGIYLHYERNEKNYFVFPKIHSVSMTDEVTEFVFTLPTGLDPSLLDRHFFVFRQTYGEQVELEPIHQNDKSFSLKVFKKSMPSFVKFDFEAFKESAETEKVEIPIVMGQDRSGKCCIFDLKKFHHVLITGVTNTGKSVYLRSVLTFLSMYFSSNELELWLGDLKRTELTLFRKLQHTKEMVTNLDDLEIMLLELKNETEKRYSFMEKEEVSHASDLKKTKFPVIVCMIDEFGLCAESKTILQLVQDLTSIGRAANVYLFVALQRADSTTTTGVMKNNLGVKISFKQSNSVNAKVAGVSGVENLTLKDKGRCVMDVGTTIKTIQTPYLTPEEVKSLTKGFYQEERKEGLKIDFEPSEDDLFGVMEDE